MTETKEEKAARLAKQLSDNVTYLQDLVDELRGLFDSAGEKLSDLTRATDTANRANESYLGQARHRADLDSQSTDHSEGTFGLTP